MFVFYDKLTKKPNVTLIFLHNISEEGFISCWWMRFFLKSVNKTKLLHTNLSETTRAEPIGSIASWIIAVSSHPLRWPSITFQGRCRYQRSLTLRARQQLPSCTFASLPGASGHQRSRRPAWRFSFAQFKPMFGSAEEIWALTLVNFSWDAKRCIRVFLKTRIHR